MATNSLYFAYGSNLDVSQMVRRCPGSRFHRRARLHGYRIEFAGNSVSRQGPVATIARDPGSHVDGALFRMTWRDWSRLDACEGSAYRRAWVRPAGAGPARTYIMDPRPVGIPAPAYVVQIAYAALELGLDAWPLLPWLIQSVSDNRAVIKAYRLWSKISIILAHYYGADVGQKIGFNDQLELFSAPADRHGDIQEWIGLRGRKTKLTEMIAENPSQAKQSILVELIASDGNVSLAADRLGISRRTATRYVSALGLKGDLERIRSASCRRRRVG